MRTPREVSESYWAAECRRDVDGVMAHYHPDATYEDGGGLHRGHAEIRAFYEGSKADYPGLELEIIRDYVGQDGWGAVEFDAALIDGAGRRFRIRGVNVVQVRDGKFTSVRSYEDAPALAGPPSAA